MRIKDEQDKTVTIYLSAQEAGGAAQAETYQGETLNFESQDVFLGRLTALRWSLMRLIMSAGEISIRESARRASRDVRRVHDDVLVLAELGLIERTASGGVRCPFTDTPGRALATGRVGVDRDGSVTASRFAAWGVDGNTGAEF